MFSLLKLRVSPATVLEPYICFGYYSLTHYHTMLHFDALKIAVKNIVRKGEITSYKKFLIFSQCFLPYMALIFHFKCTSKCRMQFVSIWTSLNFVVW